MERFSKINLELNNDLSAEDFQEKLYQWLEEQGVLPGLRTYLRHQLISALKRTHLSSHFLSKKRNNLSVKDASLNLIIAEYLVQQNYQYTASIFYSEEPRLGQLPIQLRVPDEGKEPLKFFTENEVKEILESLNMVYGTNFVREVIDSYTKDSTSLLKAIVLSIPALTKNHYLKKTQSSGDFCVEAEDFTTNRSDVRDQKGAAEKVYEHQRAKLRQDERIADEKEKSSVSGNKQNEIEKRVEEIVIKMRREMEREIAEQRKTLEDGVMVKQQRIVEMVNQLQDQQVKFQDYLKSIQEKEKMLDVKEKRLEGLQHQESICIAEKHNQIKASQQKLEEEFQRLRQEKNTVIHLQKEMEATHKQIIEVANYLGDSKTELDVLQSLNLEQGKDRKEAQLDLVNSFSSQSATNLMKSLHSAQENTAKIYQRAIHDLKEKNVKLLTLANEQQSKINKLSVTVSSLGIQLEDAMAALRLLSMKDESRSKTQQPTERHASLEEKLDQEQYDKRVYREKKVERNHQNSNGKRIRWRQRSESSSSTASSFTEDILKEARHRLRRLEIESDEVDRKYLKFKQKHLSEGFAISSLNLSKDMKLPQLEKEDSRIKYSHEKQASSPREKERAVLEVDYTHSTENHKGIETNISSKITSNYRKFNQKATNVKEKSGRNLFDVSSCTEVKSLADHGTWIASTNKNTLENNGESSPQNILSPKEIVSLLEEKLPSESEDKEIQKEDSTKEENQKNSSEKNHPNHFKLSDNLSHEDHLQMAVNTAEKNSEINESQINSVTNILLCHTNGKSGNKLADVEKMNIQIEESIDSLSSSSAKLSVGENGDKAEDIIW